MVLIAQIALGVIIAVAEPTGTLTLACKGTITNSADQKGPFSMSIKLDFTVRTVQGFGTPGLIDIPVRITGINDVTVVFGGSGPVFGTSIMTINGSIDRVTGDLEATDHLMDAKTRKTLDSTTYALQCKPTQRMF